MQMNWGPGGNEIVFFDEELLDLPANIRGLGIDGKFFPFRGGCRNSIRTAEGWNKQMFVAFPNSRFCGFFAGFDLFFDIVCLGIVKGYTIGRIVVQNRFPGKHGDDVLCKPFDTVSICCKEDEPVLVFPQLISVILQDLFCGVFCQNKTASFEVGF